MSHCVEEVGASQVLGDDAGLVDSLVELLNTDYELTFGQFS